MSNPIPWIKATASGSGNQCIELHRNGEVVQVRDSKDPNGGLLHIACRELDSWISGAKGGEFDHLTK